MRVYVNGSGVMANLLITHLIENDIKVVEKDFDIIIDFSHPQQLDKIYDLAYENLKPIVIATTGYNSEELEKISELANVVPVLHIQNTSLGMSLLANVVEYLSSILVDSEIEIIEKHHNQKIDSPSGSALYLFNKINRDDKKLMLNRFKNRAKRTNNEVGVHSIRLGNIVGEHSVIFSFNDEILELKHSALSKQVFVEGALYYAKLLVKQDKAKLYTNKELEGSL